MEVTAIAGVAALLVIAVIGGWIGYARSRRSRIEAAKPSQTQLAPADAQAMEPIEAVPLERPSKIVVTAGEQEVMSMTVVSPDRMPILMQHATQLDTTTLSRFVEPIMQVAPSMATAAMAGSKQLMEVSINGNLIAAADGNGLRAMAMGGTGVTEHARLFEPKNLQNVANAAAIWQIASVVVAQKHLADISETLKRVESKVDGVQSFMEEQRLAIVQSVMHYLDDARKALQRGEFLDRTRSKLEDFEIELERVSLSLVAQIQRESEARLENDFFGSEGEYESALRKHTKIKRYVDELTLCNEVRLANWYLCSLYRDQSQMLDSRLTQIRAAADQGDELRKHLDRSMQMDCAQIDAKLVIANTVAKRQRAVRGVSATPALEESRKRFHQIFLRMASVAADKNATQRLIVESENGVPSAIYLCN